MPKDFDNVVPHTKLRSLRGALRKVRLAQAEQTDVLSDLQEAQNARLEILLEALRDVIDEIPQEEDQFLFQITTGTAPRLWVDITSHVLMGRDQKTYRFLKDTRLGRVVLLESPEVDAVADALTEYIAERMIERARAVDTDWLIDRAVQRRRSTAGRFRGQNVVLEEEESLLPSDPFGNGTPSLGKRKRGTGKQLWFPILALLTFIGGIFLGILGLIAYAWLATLG